MVAWLFNQVFSMQVLRGVVCLLQSLEELIDKAVPRDIRVNKQLHFDSALG